MDNREKKGVYYLEERLSSNHMLKTSIVASAVLTLIAHGYNFLNSTFANDRISFFSNPVFGTEDSGKWFLQYYEFIKACSYVPWLIGILSILFLTVSVYITAEVLQAENRLSIWLMAGLYTTNVSVITANLYTMDEYMFAFAMASLSVGIWYLGACKKEGGLCLFRRHISLRVLTGALALSFCLGVYGSYASVAPCLVILGCMVMLLQGEKVGYVVRRWLEYVVTFAVGLVVYYGILRIFLHIRGTEMTSYMGEDRLVNGASLSEIAGYIKLSFVNTLRNWCGKYEGNSSYQSMPQWMALVLLCVGLVLLFIQIIANRELLREKKRILFLIVLLICFPFSAGMIYILAFGNAHYLMIFSFVFLYIGVAKISEMELIDEKAEIRIHSYRKWLYRSKQVLSCIAIILLICFICRGILAANLAYNGMEKKYTVSRSIATRMIDRIENTEGYTGTEDVVLVGHIMDGDYFYDSTGNNYWKKYAAGLGVATESTSFSHSGITPLFLNNVMGFSRPVVLYQSGMFTDEEKQAIASMKPFPLGDSTRKINNYIVVKLSDIEM